MPRYDVSKYTCKRNYDAVIRQTGSMLRLRRHTSADGIRAPIVNWVAAAALCSLSPLSFAQTAELHASPRSAEWRLPARIVAMNLPKAYGIRQVGRFHSGGPMASNPEFAIHTQPGRVLDPGRVLVAIESNLGERRADERASPGAILSIEPSLTANRQPLDISKALALRSDGGRRHGAPVQIYSLQSKAYLNGRHNRKARTAGFTAVAGPRYVSINNAFGRPWIANAPFGLHGPGSESVVDPDGAPLANAPSGTAGGVFAGSSTARQQAPKSVRSGFFASAFNYRRSPQLTSGTLSNGALGTAFLGPSPDGSGFAVFAIVTGEGAITQAHVQDGVDGLAPPGTIAIRGFDPGVIGIAFKWAPTRMLYVADPLRNRIALLHLTDDTRHFKLQRSSEIRSTSLNHPIDIAAAIPEIANPHFSSHTTLSGDADVYVINRGDGSVVRLSQSGKLIARAVIQIGDGQIVGADRLRSIAVSADAQKLWLIVDSPPDSGAANVLVEVPAFDANGPFAADRQTAAAHAASPAASRGRAMFSKAFAPDEGLGPRFNANSCVVCHPGPGGASPREEHFVRRVARLNPLSGRLMPVQGKTNQIAPRFSVSAHGSAEPEASLPAREANVISMRMPLSLFGIGRIDDIPDAAIEAQAVSKGDGIKGRVHYLKHAKGIKRVGRYGWKGEVVTLEDMVAQAFSNELGIANPMMPGMQAAAAEDDGSIIRSTVEFLRTLRRPAAAR